MFDIQLNTLHVMK